MTEQEMELESQLIWEAEREVELELMSRVCPNDNGACDCCTVCWSGAIGPTR